MRHFLRRKKEFISYLVTYLFHSYPFMSTVELSRGYMMSQQTKCGNMKIQLSFIKPDIKGISKRM